MRKLSQTFRAAALLLALLNLSSRAVATWAETRLWASPFGPDVVHVEGQSSSDCPRAHPLDCEFCKQVLVGSGPAAAPPAPVVDPAAGGVPQSCAAVGPAAELGTAALPRAPPAA